MIEPDLSHIGKAVTWIGNQHWGGKDETGTITSISDKFVFVDFDGTGRGIACRREELEWAS